MLPRVAIAVTESMRQRIFDEPAGTCCSISEPWCRHPLTAYPQFRASAAGGPSCIYRVGIACLNEEVLAQQKLALSPTRRSVKAFVTMHLWTESAVTSAAAVMAVR